MNKETSLVLRSYSLFTLKQNPMKLLNIISSPRGDKSRTISVANEFLKALKAKHPGLEIQNLDLFKTKLPEVLGSAVDAKYAKLRGEEVNDEVQKSWDEIIKYSNEFISADIYLVSAPMWNFSISYNLKQYIDIIMQAGVLFSFTATGVVGLAKNKKMICVTSRGNNYSKGSGMEQFDFQESYLRAIFGFAGITDIRFIHAQPMDYDPEITKVSLSASMEDAKKLASAI